MRFKKDRSGRWMMDYQASALLKIIKLPPYKAYRSVSSDQVAPRRIPDGLFEVHFDGRPKPTPVLIEVENFWDKDADRQMLEAIFTVRLTYHVIPDAVLIVLSPRGNDQSTSTITLDSTGGTVAGIIRWQTIRMWEIDAEELFAFDDAGMAPWITLAKTTQPPAQFLERCKELLDSEPPSPRLEELRIVTGFFASIRYNQFNVSDYFSGVSKMIYSPLLDKIGKVLDEGTDINALSKTEKIILERMQQSHSHALDLALVRGKLESLREVIVEMLQTRFGHVPETLVEKLKGIKSLEKLKELTGKASQILTLEELMSDV